MAAKTSYGAKGGTKDSQITEIRERFEYATNAWADIKAEGQKDMRYVAGDPWDPKDREKRRDAGRPCLALDELGQYFNQLINDVRANKRGVRFSPVGNGANDQAAEFYQDKMREIEYRSHAQIAYTVAFENAVQRGYGYCRVNYGYASERSFHKELTIEEIANPDMVVPDPEFRRPDMSDQKVCFVYETWDLKEFQRTFTKANPVDMSLLQSQAPMFVRDHSVVLSEYWCVKTTKRTLVLFQPEPPQQPEGVSGFRPMPPPPPQAVFADELERIKTKLPGRAVREREVEYPHVKMCLTNGLEVLEETEWPGKYIPIIGCLGKVLYVDEGGGAKRHILSMTRLARDPYMLYCYYRTAEAEMVGMTPKFPYFYYEGTLRPDQVVLLQKSLHEPVAAIAVKPTTELTGPNLLPMPQRQPYDPPIAALEVGAEAARRAIQSAMGSGFLPTAAQRKNEKSGIALREIEASSQKGTFHFIDHYNDMIRQVGVVIEDLMDKILVEPQEVAIQRANETAAHQRINDPNDKDSVNIRGDYQVTISSGPSFESQRAEASAFADLLAQNPQVFPLIGPLVVKLKNLGPIGDEIADALKVLQPPALQAKEGQEDIPPAIAAQMQQGQELIMALSQKVQQLEQQIQTDAVKQQAETQREMIDARTKLALEEMRSMLQTSIQEMKGAQALALQALKGRQGVDEREDTQRHDMAMGAAEASSRRQALPQGDGAGM